MLRTTTTTDLHSLLPTLVGPLPPPLTSLATSLVVQSNSRISNLKPTEEIARSYVCSHLACERLKNALDLPTIKPNPPLLKRQYESLLSHFRAALPEAATKKATRNRAGPGSYDRGAVQDIIAFVERLGLPGGVAGQIVQGVRETEHEASERAAVVVVCAMYVVERMAIEGRSSTMAGINWKRGNAGQYNAKREALMEAFGDAELKKSQVDGWIKKLHPKNGGGAWIEGVPEGVGFWMGKKRSGGQSGGDRMLRGEVDYLSEKKLKVFEQWRERILQRCDEIDAKG